MERTDHLWPDGPVFFFDDALFAPGTDSFLLSSFTRVKRGETVCDLGAGTGLLGLLLLAREPSLVLHNVEIQPDALTLAEKTYQANAFSAQQHLADLRALDGVLSPGSFDLVISNPPYFKFGSGQSAATSARQTAREETTCTIDDLCRAAARLLRWGGRLSIVYRPERLCDLLWAMRSHGIEPKRLRMVQSTAAAAPSLILAEGRRGGKSGLIIEPPLILRNADGSESDDYRAAYFRL